MNLWQRIKAMFGHDDAIDKYADPDPQRQRDEREEVAYREVVWLVQRMGETWMLEALCKAIEEVKTASGGQIDA